MLWDPTLESWQQLGITGQPAAALFGADGSVLGAWSGPIPEDDVVDLLSS